MTTVLTDAELIAECNKIIAMLAGSSQSLCSNYDDRGNQVRPLMYLTRRLAERNATLERVTIVQKHIRKDPRFNLPTQVVLEHLTEALAPAQKEAAVERQQRHRNNQCGLQDGHWFDCNVYYKHKAQPSSPDAAPDAQREARERIAEAFTLANWGPRDKPTWAFNTLEQWAHNWNVFYERQLSVADAILAAAKAGERR